MSTPDTTANQILALVAGIVGLFVAFGLVDNDRAQAIIGAAAIIVPAAWIIADSIIRHGRARAVAPPPTTIINVPSGGEVSSNIRPGEAQGAPPGSGDAPPAGE